MTRTLAALLSLTLCACCACPEREPEVVAPTSTAAVAPATSQAPQVAAAPAVTRRTPTTISISVENADLNDVMQQIGAKVGQNILVDPKVQETVSITLHDVPWREAVALIAKLTRCEVVVLPERLDSTYR